MKPSEQSSDTESDDVVFVKFVFREMTKLSDDSLKRSLKRKIISDIYDTADEQQKKRQYIVVLTVFPKTSWSFQFDLCLPTSRNF